VVRANQPARHAKGVLRTLGQTASSDRQMLPVFRRFKTTYDDTSEGPLMQINRRINALFDSEFHVAYFKVVK
jgi:hypothetical protein